MCDVPKQLGLDGGAGVAVDLVRAWGFGMQRPLLYYAIWLPFNFPLRFLQMLAAHAGRSESNRHPTQERKAVVVWHA